MALFGARRNQMAAFIVNNRLNASRNPDAVFYEQPVSVDDYLSSQMIVEPFSLLDCDMPVDGAGALVLTTEDNARQARHPVAYVAGCATFAGNFGSVAATLLEDHEAAAGITARSLWTSTSLTVDDVDSANFYDGFSYFTYLYLEAFGFCGRGEAHEFIQGGRIATDGPLPLNTSGGSLGMGRLHGPPQVIESVRQLQGRCGDRQITKAETILAVTGQPHYSMGALLLSSDRQVAYPRWATNE
jgi:acetyl-CoA acetyltransferase